MKVRYKHNGGEAYSSQFNTHALSEVLTGDDSPFIKDLDVFIPWCPLYDFTGWIDMRAAFELKYIINDNYNTCFFQPRTMEDMKRGYTI